MSGICEDDDHPIDATRRLLEQEGASLRLSIGQLDDGLGTYAVRRPRQDHVDSPSVTWVTEFTDRLTEPPQQAELAGVAER